LLQEKYGHLFTVHRLDKDTSGVIVFARNEQMHAFLSTAFTDRKVGKEYHGLVTGIPLEKKGTIDAPIMEHPAKKGSMMVHRNGKPSLTDYEVLEVLGRFAWMRFQIHTGRTHQIRVHMQHIGNPIACDPLYGDGQPILLSSIKKNYKLSLKEEEEKPLLGRLALHASQLSFILPDGKHILLEAPLPKDLHATLQQLRKAMEKRGKGK
jgi:23S rRNA pseudouridine955/2504/2580 synthase/23S rRNA pseudouridine1911/1915/1917 synthase